MNFEESKVFANSFTFKTEINQTHTYLYTPTLPHKLKANYTCSYNTPANLYSNINKLKRNFL